MKGRLFTILVLALLLAATATIVWADKPIATDAEGNEIAWKSSGCTRIQDAELYTSDGELVTTGYSQWGYNYQAHMFNGMYCDYHPVYRPGGANHEWCIAYYGDVELVMKWNDAWLANTDCDNDGLLDRHYGLLSYSGSGAWTTNHMRGAYESGSEVCEWDYFVKIVAAPADATSVGGIWYNADGVEIGPAIWGAFAIIQEVENDPCAGIDGLQYSSPDHPGLGGW
jgi:hypothetical protein